MAPIDVNPERRNDNLLQSVDHALQMLEVLSVNPSIGVGDAAKLMGIGKSTAFRLLSTLESRGFVKKDENAKYRLSLKIAYLGSLVLNTFDIARVAHPELESLSLSIGETVHLVVLDDRQQACFIDKVICPTTSFRMESTIGAQKSAYSTATGKVLLAYRDPSFQAQYAQSTAMRRYTAKTLTSPEALLNDLHAIRERGYGFDEEESEQGLFCVAAPVFDYTGAAVAAISASGPSERMQQKLNTVLTQLQDTCRRVSAELR